MNKKIFKVFPLILIFLGGCKLAEAPVDPAEEVINTGSADFTSFVVLGNSLSSGYQSNSLYKSAQEYSFGNLIAKQVKTKFEQPLISDPGTGGRIELASTSPFKLKINLDSGTPVNQDLRDSYNNLGIPGAYTYDIVNAYDKSTSYQGLGGNGSDLFNIILRNKGSQFQQAKTLRPTFLIMWIGNNDILGHALSGGVYPATPVSSFQTYYKQLADSLASLHTQVMVANVFNVTLVPYFTYTGIQLQINGVDSVWGITGTGDTLLMSLDKNFLTLTSSIQEVFDLQGKLTGRGLSKNLPVRNQFILDEAETKTAEETVAQYNDIISAQCKEHGFSLVDFNSLLKTIKGYEKFGGYIADGEIYTTLYYFGNLFSLDGVHPSNKGYAILANEFIKTINTKYNAEVPLIKVSGISNNYKAGKSTTFTAR